MDSSSAGSTQEATGRAKPNRLAVLYDRSCSLCRLSAEAVRIFDNSDAIDLIDLHDDYGRSQFPGLQTEDLMAELHVVDDRGRVWRGARAVNEVLRHQSGVRGLLAWLWYVPGYAWLADRQYKRIARARYVGNKRPVVLKPSVPTETGSGDRGV
jgi:predicted DCC family thiol-disulfide oxidoreductase YuxK